MADPYRQIGALWIAAVVLAGGCYRSHVAEETDGMVNDAGLPAVHDAGPPPPTDELDLLLMVDNSNSMLDEQVSLAEGFPRLLRALASGDLDSDGAPDRAPFVSIQVGVITSDMGTGGFSTPTCGRSDFGDDGVLMRRGSPELDGCLPAYPPILTWDTSGTGSLDQTAHDLRCIAVAGTGGCGFEQQLEAPLKALSPTRATSWTAAGYAPPTFFRNSAPHGDVENEGFVRPDSLLAVVVLSDEDDCSARDPEIYDAASTTYPGDLNLRCFMYGDRALHPIERYVDGFLQLRRHPSRFAFFVLAGVPVDLVPHPGAPIPWDRLVGGPSVRDPRMTERVDPSMPHLLVPSCNVPGRGVAMPPIRIVETARGLQSRGARVAVGSLCQADFGEPIASFLLSLR